jgi:hypothetical protein
MNLTIVVQAGLQGPAVTVSSPAIELSLVKYSIGHVRPDALRPVTGLIRGGQELGSHLGISQIDGVDEDAQKAFLFMSEPRRLLRPASLAAEWCYTLSAS